MLPSRGLYCVGLSGFAYEVRDNRLSDPSVRAADEVEVDMSEVLLNRRSFNGLCAAFGSSLPALSAMFGALSGASTLAAAIGKSSNGGAHTVKSPDGRVVPALGQGSWHLGQGRHQAVIEEEALRLGLSLGMRLIDTAENYGDGRSEELISHVITGQRERVFLVSKVETNHVTGDGVARACEFEPCPSRH